MKINAMIKQNYLATIAAQLNSTHQQRRMYVIHLEINTIVNASS